MHASAVLEKMIAVKVVTGDGNRTVGASSKALAGNLTTNAIAVKMLSTAAVVRRRLEYVRTETTRAAPVIIGYMMVYGVLFKDGGSYVGLWDKVV